MKRLKRLQEQLKAGKISHEEYLEQIQELLDDEMITEEQHTEAKAVEAPKGDDDLKYSQEDVDKIVKKKAEALIKKAYRNAGLEVPKGQDLTEAVTEALKAGDTAGKNDTELAKEVTRLKGELSKSAGSAGKLASLQRENAILKVAGEYQPHNVARVVAALDDYEDLLDYDDETGKLDPKSVKRVLGKIVKAEPYLFKTDGADGGAGGEGGEGAGEQGKGDDVKGKGPGGGSGGETDEKVTKDLAAARELMGWNKSEEKNN